MKKYLFYFALASLLIAVIVHILSLVEIHVNETMPFVWLLHLGIFIAFVPAFIEIMNNEELKIYQQAHKKKLKNPLKIYGIIFKDTPLWMKILLAGVFVYAIVNFMLFMSSQHGGPVFRNGQYILENHGQLIRVLTEQEYHHYKANELRGFSGHWILFYGFATVILYKFSGLATLRKNKLTNRQAMM